MRTLFISDLHLSAASAAANAQFEALLAGEARTAAALYVLGDLFEYWIGDDDDDPVHRSLCAALRRLTASGVACYVMRGNRDFLLGAAFATRTGCRLLSDPSIVVLGDERVLLTHGDALCTGDLAYQHLRAHARRGAWQRRALALPLPTRRALAGGARAGSRAHTGQTADYIMDVTPEAVRLVMLACDVRTLIHGHTHRPGISPVPLAGGRGQRIVLGAWHDGGSLLCFDERGYALRSLPPAG